MVADLLQRAARYPETKGVHSVIMRCAKNIAYYQSIELIGQTDKRIKYIRQQLEDNELIINTMVQMLSFIFSLKDDNEQKEKCISMLYGDLQHRDIDNYLLKEHLQQTINSYDVLYELYSQKKTVNLFQLTANKYAA